MDSNLPPEAIDAIHDYLYQQAKRCQNPNGTALLLSLKDYLLGRQTMEGCQELWQVADVLARTPTPPPHTQPG
jgi:hypothetical protein